MNRQAIRELTQLRRLLEHMYTYGFFSREEFLERKIASSKRMHDNMVRLIRDLYFLDDEDYQKPAVNVLTDGKYKRYRFKRDYFAGQTDCLKAVYGLHGTGDEDAIPRLLYCLSLAAGQKGGASVQDVVQATSESGFGGEDGTDFTTTINRRMNALQAAGYLEKSGKKRAARHHVDWEALTDVELTELYYLVSFFSGTGYPRVAASFLRDAVRRQLLSRGLDTPPEAFLFRDNACGNMLDEDIVHQLLDCCAQHKKTEIIRNDQTATIIEPVYLRPDTRHGRWYLMALRNGAATIVRISAIQEIKPLSETFDYDAAQGIVDNAFRHRMISGAAPEQPTCITAELRFDNENLRQQFEREMLIGHIERRGDKEYYCAEIDDPVELRPFLRAYGPWLHVLPHKEDKTAEELLAEYERTLKNYGVV